MSGWRAMQQGRDAANCKHCGQKINRIRFAGATGDPYLWVHYDGTRQRCGRELSSPYAAPEDPK